MSPKTAHFPPSDSAINKLFLSIACLGLSLLTACANVIPPCAANGERISGSTGCNRFTARITEDARGFTLDQIASTKMACTPQRMELENDFLYELNDYRTIVRNGDQLLMIGADREVLSFMQKNNTAK